MAPLLKFKDIKKIALPILRRNDVVKAGIFGSAARDELKNGSDVDFLVKFKGRKSLLDLVRLKHELEDNLKREVDVLTYSSVHHLIKKEVLGGEVKLI